MPVSKLLTFPLGSYLLLRLDYVVICGDELEAKILRLVEQYMEDERRNLYRDFLNDPKNEIRPEDTIEITRDVWVTISHRTFLYDLYHLVKSENTLKKALKSLIHKRFLTIDQGNGKQYEAPRYQINITVVQQEFDTLATLGKAGYQKLIPSKSDTVKNSPHQNLPPSGEQNLIPSSQSRGAKIDTHSNKILDGKKETEEGAYAPLPPIDFTQRRNAKTDPALKAISLSNTNDEEEEPTEKRAALRSSKQTQAAGNPLPGAAMSLHDRAGDDTCRPASPSAPESRRMSSPSPVSPLGTAPAAPAGVAAGILIPGTGAGARQGEGGKGTSGLTITHAPTSTAPKQGKFSLKEEEPVVRVETAAQILRRQERRRDEILELYGRELGRKPSRSKDNLDGALLCAQDDVGDEDITKTIRTILADPFMAKHISMTYVYKKLDALARAGSAPPPEVIERDPATVNNLAGAGKKLAERQAARLAAGGGR